MKRLLSLLVCSAMLAGVPVSHAAVPETMSYQGVLTDVGGAPVPDGPYDLTFNLYDALTDGTLLWSETQTAVPVTGGGFSVLLGSVVPLTLPFDAPYYLGISVGADPELAPRIPLASSPYGLGLRLPFAGSVSSAASAFTIDNSGGGPALVLTGPSGDAAVMLPPDAVSAAEVLDEPGVAGITADSPTSVSTAVTMFLSRTISVPADGYVLAMATCDLTLFHSLGTVDNLIVGVSTSGSTIPTNHDVIYSLGGALPTDLYTFPIAIQGLFQVTAGAQTFYFVGRRTGAGVNAGDKQLSLIYFPTAYGILALAATPGSTDGAGSDGASTEADLGNERSEAERFNNDRMRRELDAMQAKLASLEARVAADAKAAHPSGASNGGIR